jgi:hypothetical protein
MDSLDFHIPIAAAYWAVVDIRLRKMDPRCIDRAGLALDCPYEAVLMMRTDRDSDNAIFSA